MSTYYSEDHEWITVEGDTAIIGITAHAAEQLGEVVFIELKDAGDEFEKGDEIGVIESVKAASDIIAPVSGAVTEANAALSDAPATVNESPEKDGWMYKVKMSNASQVDALMDAEAYKAFTA